MLTGQVKPTSGHIFFQGEDITNVPAHRRIHLGIGRSFQITSLFNGLKVMDNMLLAVQGTRPERFEIVRPLKRNKQLINKAGELLDSFDLWDLKNEPVSCISYGAQRKLEIALSMASSPRLLMLDEPSSGLTAAESASCAPGSATWGRTSLSSASLTIWTWCSALRRHFFLLHYGEVMIEGTPEEIKGSPVVREIYMGGQTTC